MTREKFERVKAAGVKKWTEGAAQTEETFAEWWRDEGKAPCVFCYNFFCEHGAGDDNTDTPRCPIESSQATEDDCCADEWNHMYALYGHGNLSLETFHANALALCDRIAALNYEDLKQ